MNQTAALAPQTRSCYRAMAMEEMKPREDEDRRRKRGGKKNKLKKTKKEGQKEGKKMN